MSTNIESYNAVAGQAREATERSIHAFQPVTRYFEYVQKSIDLNRGLAARWVELLTTTSGSFLDRAGKTVKQADKVASVGSGEYLTRSEEQLHVGTEKVQVGRARLRKVVVTEQQTVTIPVSREEVRLVREPVAPGDTADATIGEAAAEVVLTEERVVVSKETVPVERV